MNSFLLYVFELHPTSNNVSANISANLFLLVCPPNYFLMYISPHLQSLIHQVSFVNQAITNSISSQDLKRF